MVTMSFPAKHERRYYAADSADSKNTACPFMSVHRGINSSRKTDNHDRQSAELSASSFVRLSFSVIDLGLDNGQFHRPPMLGLGFGQTYDSLRRSGTCGFVFPKEA